MTDFIIKKLPYVLTSHAGLALVGRYVKRLGVSRRVDRKFPVDVGGIANSDILKSYLGLLVQGKNDFEAIEEFRGARLRIGRLDDDTGAKIHDARDHRSVQRPRHARAVSF